MPRSPCDKHGRLAPGQGSIQQSGIIVFFKKCTQSSCSSRWIEHFSCASSRLHTRQRRNLSEGRCFGSRVSWREQQANRKGKVQLRQLLAITNTTITHPPNPSHLAGNKQSFSTDRYMLNPCYLHSQTDQIVDYKQFKINLKPIRPLCQALSVSYLSEGRFSE